MAIWQYDFYMISKAELAEKLGGVPSRLTPEEFKRCRFWHTCQPVQDFDARFTRWHEEIKAWNPELRWWGNEQSNRIDVWQKNGRVTMIEFRIELRTLDLRFIQLLVDVARDSDCVLFSQHSREIVEPLREHLLEHLVRSNGANEIWDWLRDPSAFQVKRHTPRVFLSHSSLDKAFVSKLAVDLRANNVPVWYSKWELKVGDSLSSKIADGIRGSGWLAVALSKNSVKSPWVERELNTALAIELEKQDVFVLPIVVDDCAIPPFLLDKLYADFRMSYQSGLNSLLYRVLGRTEG